MVGVPHGALWSYGWAQEALWNDGRNLVILGADRDRPSAIPTLRMYVCTCRYVQYDKAIARSGQYTEYVSTTRETVRAEGEKQGGGVLSHP